MCYYEHERLVEQMLKESKTDQLLLHGFQFDGKVKKYLRHISRLHIHFCDKMMHSGHISEYDLYQCLIVFLNLNAIGNSKID